MTLEHHPLIKEFPEYRAEIHRLKTEDAEFRQLFDEYHEVDREVFRIDQDLEPVSDATAGQLKRRRLFLKDWLFQRLREAAHG